MIIFIFGEDSFRSRQKLAEYRERFLKKYGPQGDLTEIDAEEKDIKFLEILRSQGLFSSVRLIVLKNLISQYSKERQEEIIKILKSNEDLLLGKGTIIIFWEANIPKNNSVLFKFFLRSAKMEKFSKFKGVELINWTNSQLNKINPATKIRSAAAEKLFAYTAENTERISNELRKLSNFKGEGEISETDIDRLVSTKLTYTIFETIEAASSGNKKRALLLLHTQLTNKEDPFYVLLMYAYQIRNLLKIGEYYWRNISNKVDISKKTGIHPFVVQKALLQIRNFTLPQLKRLFRSLQKIDLEAKTGKIDIKLALDKFLVEL